MSALKLLHRVAAPDIEATSTTEKKLAMKIHEYTLGLNGDPLTHFAVIMAAICHDVDHSGLPNTQLIKENSSIARFYDNRSPAEQHSTDLAFHLLMDDKYEDLRRELYTSECDFKRFRSILVNSVMATDIMDKELGAARKARWARAFSGDSSIAIPEKQMADQKATIVLEHLIQASDVAHTMQHWHIYQKWNSRLFQEQNDAFVNGRSDVNPADNWYEGELGFFDFYVIPLAKKLASCGVFGVASDEYLTYATQNRKEWELRGKNIVEDLVKLANFK